MNDQQGPNNVPVKKEECVYHVNKRMGSRLQKLKKQNVTPVQTKTGKTFMWSELGGAHMLPDGIIDKLTSYYGRAILENINSNEETMRQAVWASIHHSSATRDSSHIFCLKGIESWCWWRAALAEGKTPLSHKENRPILYDVPYEKLILVQTIYADLASP